MKNTDEVAIFWDYENCPAPTNTSGYAIVKNIRSVARTFGNVKLFKAYLEVTEHLSISRAPVLRSELQSSGVSLTDCPHNGRKDVADKMILVDMLAHAIDNPAPSTIVLISGDRDFAYALSILSLRGYRVILITLSNAHPSLTEQASLCFDWISDILESTKFPHQPTTPRHGKSSSLPTHEKFYSDPSPRGHNPSRFPCQDSYGEKSAGSVEFFQVQTTRSENFRTTPKHDTRHNFLPLDLDSESKRQFAASSAASDTLPKGPESSARVIHSPEAATSSSDTYLNSSMETVTPLTMTPTCSSNSSRNTLTSTTSIGSTPNLAIVNESIVASRSSGHNALRESAQPPGNLAQHETVWAEPMSIESAMQIMRAETHLRESSSSSQQGTHPLINTKMQSPLSVDQIYDDNGDPLAVSPLAYSDIPPPANVIATLSPSAPFFMTPSSLSPTTAVAPVAKSPVKAANSRRAPSLPVPDKFKILIQCLKTHRSRRTLRPLRSKVSSEIAHNGTTYRQAGVSDFDEYVAMAEKAGFVELGGSESTEWIDLKPLYYNVRLS